MNRFLLKITLSIIILISVLFAAVLVNFYSRKQDDALFGGHIFQDISKVDKITIINETGSVNLHYAGGVWVNDDRYFVNNNMVDKFLYVIRSPVNISFSEIGADYFKTQITVFSEGEKVSFFYFYDTDENKGYIKLNNIIYETSNDFIFPESPEGWFVQPLLKLSDDDIEDIYGLDVGFSFDKLFFYRAVSRDSFDLKDAGKFRIIMRNGVVADVFVHNISGDYWVEIKLSKTVLPTKDAADYIKYNSPLYEGWIFKISGKEGADLYDGIN